MRAPQRCHVFVQKLSRSEVRGIPMRLMHTPKKVDIDDHEPLQPAMPVLLPLRERRRGAGKDLPAAEWLRFFEELNRCAVTEVTLAGGEPFIREDLREIIGGIVRNRMRFADSEQRDAYHGRNGELSRVDGTLQLRAGLHRRLRSGDPRLHAGQGELREGHAGPYDSSAPRGSLGGARDHSPKERQRSRGHCETSPGGYAAFLLRDQCCRSRWGCVGRTPRWSSSRRKSGCYAMETLLRLSKKYNGRINAMAGPLADARAGSRWSRRGSRADRLCRTADR